MGEKAGDRKMWEGITAMKQAMNSPNPFIKGETRKNAPVLNVQLPYRSNIWTRGTECIF